MFGSCCRHWFWVCILIFWMLSMIPYWGLKQIPYHTLTQVCCDYLVDIHRGKIKPYQKKFINHQYFFFFNYTLIFFYTRLLLVPLSFLTSISTIQWVLLNKHKNATSSQKKKTPNTNNLSAFGKKTHLRFLSRDE